MAWTLHIAPFFVLALMVCWGLQFLRYSVDVMRSSVLINYGLSLLMIMVWLVISRLSIRSLLSAFVGCPAPAWVGVLILVTSSAIVCLFGGVFGGALPLLGRADGNEPTGGIETLAAVALLVLFFVLTRRDGVPECGVEAMTFPWQAELERTAAAAKGNGVAGMGAPTAAAPRQLEKISK